MTGECQEIVWELPELYWIPFFSFYIYLYIPVSLCVFAYVRLFGSQKTLYRISVLLPLCRFWALGQVVWFGGTYTRWATSTASLKSLLKSQNMHQFKIGHFGGSCDYLFLPTPDAKGLEIHPKLCSKTNVVRRCFGSHLTLAPCLMNGFVPMQRWSRVLLVVL